jgi:hypothetical protein
MNVSACADGIGRWMIMDKEHALRQHIPTEQHMHKNYSGKTKMLLCHTALSLRSSSLLKKTWRENQEFPNQKYIPLLNSWLVLPLISVLTVLQDGGLSWDLPSSDFVPKEIFKGKNG